jgi:DNA-binding transcriptional LysR family regulator
VPDAAALETFVAIARSGSLMRAADRLHRTQPSLSARLAALEDAWATKLFRRHARGMTLTPEGARLLPLAEAALSGLEAVARAAGEPLGGRNELRIGSGDALGREIVPRALARLLRGNPSLSVRLVEGTGSRLIEALRGGEIDLALVVRQDAGVPGPGIAIEPLLVSPVDVLFPAGERLPAAAIHLTRLRGRRIVTLQPGSGFRRHVEEAFLRAGLPFRPSVEVGNLSLVRRFVAAGLGVAPVPAIAFGPGGSDRAIARRRLRGVPELSYALARRAGVPLAAVASRFLEGLRSKK